MTKEELVEIITCGETSTVQFKQQMTTSKQIAEEMVAFANCKGGIILFGIEDKTGQIIGLSYSEIQQISHEISTAANDQIRPAIYLQTEVVVADGKRVLVAHVMEGTNKPYKTLNGNIWVKQGSDKRKVVSNERMLSMMQECGRVCADKRSVDGSSIHDISETSLKMLLSKRYSKELALAGLNEENATIENMVDAVAPNFTIERLLQNLSLMDAKGQLTLAGLLLVGKNIKRFVPVFTIKCISFVGNTVAGNQYRDYLPESEMEGNLLTQYTAAMNFVSRNLMTKQKEDNFNSNGQLEIPLSVFVELIVNALVHRDYYQSSAIRLFVFDNRIELHSPGILPSDLTVDDIKKGISKPRNQLLFEFARYFLPYTGVGSGILRVSQAFDNVDYYNDLDLDEFRIIIPRKMDLTQMTNVPHDVPHDVPHEKGEKSRQEHIMELVRMNPGITRELMAKLLGVNAKTIGRELAKMKDKITYRGSGNHGHWEVIEIQ